jgi:amino acid transporter
MKEQKYPEPTVLKTMITSLFMLTSITYAIFLFGAIVVIPEQFSYGVLEGFISIVVYIVFFFFYKLGWSYIFKKDKEYKEKYGLCYDCNEEYQDKKSKCLAIGTVILIIIFIVFSSIEQILIS